MNRDGQRISPYAPLLFLLPLLVFFLRLGASPLFDVDEGAFSEATREMFARGDFLSTYLNGVDRFDKPILIYWLQALGYLVFGPTEWAFRFPSALAASLWCYATWFFARERFGPQAAFAAMTVAATAIGPVAIGRAATADGLLNLLLALTLFDAWRHLESSHRAPLLRSFFWMALGVLTKGPVAILIPAAVSFLYCASRGEWKRWLRAVFDPYGWAILIVVAVPWYAIALSIHGQAFIDGFIMKHNVKRFSGTLEGHSGSLFYYVLAVPLLLLPWTGPLLAALRGLRTDLGTGVRRFLWIWAGFVVVFFTLSGTKLPHYVLYGSTPLFLLIAAHRDELKRGRLHLLPAGILLLALLLLPWILDALAGSSLGNAFYRAQLSRAQDLAGAAYLVPMGLALALWLGFMLVPRIPLWTRLGSVAAVEALVMVAVLHPYAGELLQGPVRTAGERVRVEGAPAVTWRFTAPSFSVYRQAVTESREPAPGELALTRRDRVPASGYTTVYQEGGVALIRRDLP